MLLLLLLALFLALYGGLYAAAVYHFDTTPQHYLANRFLCCWADLYSGKAPCIYKVIFCPIVLPLHALRVYACHCLHLYGRRLFWLACGRCTSYFVDEEFRPEATSLGQVDGDAANAEAGSSNSDTIWVRAMDFNKPKVGERPRHPHLHSTDMCLFEGSIEPRDILQGALGDCWLLAAMATLADHECAISSLFLTREVDPRGKYYIRLFNPPEGKWEVLVIDDYVPCERDSRAEDGVRRGSDGLPTAQYARPHGKEIWAMLLEKAFAKLCGSYAAIEAGHTEWGIMCMTGGSAWRYEIADSGIWERSDLVIIGDSANKRSCGFRPTAEHHSSGELFELLRFYHRQGAVLCCGGVKESGVMQGLVQKHAFSLLQVRTARKSWDSDQYFRFVQIRNPWGTGEWTGPWSDSSQEWEWYPYVQEQLSFQRCDDGTYWMQWEDFCEYWSYVGCVDLSRDIHTLSAPLHRETERTGPLKACLRGCGRFWCLCSGIRHFFMTHQASSEQVAETEFRTTCGLDPSGLYCRICEHEAVHIDGPGGCLVVDPYEWHRDEESACSSASAQPLRQHVEAPSLLRSQDRTTSNKLVGEPQEWADALNSGHAPAIRRPGVVSSLFGGA